MYKARLSQVPFPLFRLRRQNMPPESLFSLHFARGREPKMLLDIAPGFHFWHDLRFLLWGLR